MHAHHETNFLGLIINTAQVIKFGKGIHLALAYTCNCQYSRMSCALSLKYLIPGPYEERVFMCRRILNSSSGRSLREDGGTGKLVNYHT